MTGLLLHPSSVNQECPGHVHHKGRCNALGSVGAFSSLDMFLSEKYEAYNNTPHFEKKPTNFKLWARGVSVKLKNLLFT